VLYSAALVLIFIICILESLDTTPTHLFDPNSFVELGFRLAIPKLSEEKSVISLAQYYRFQDLTSVTGGRTPLHEQHNQ
jgi:hypothetical protein